MRWVPVGVVTVTALALTGCSASQIGIETGGPSQIKAIPTTEASAWPTKCLHGSVSVLVVHLQNPPLCVVVGTTLTLTFDKKHQGIGNPGPWAVPPVSSLNGSTMSVQSSKKSGSFLIAHTYANAVGSTSIQASFNQECSGPGSSPCTIPPEASFTVNVNVVA